MISSSESIDVNFAIQNGIRGSIPPQSPTSSLGRYSGLENSLELCLLLWWERPVSMTGLYDHRYGDLQGTNQDTVLKSEVTEP